MNLIFKSYLKSFKKNIFSTCAIIFFMILLSIITFGLLSTPLQIKNHISKAKNNSVSYDYSVKFSPNAQNYSNDFLYNFFFLRNGQYSGELSAKITDKNNNQVKKKLVLLNQDYRSLNF